MLGDFGVKRRSHMTVRVERERDRTVAEEFLNDLGKHAAIEQMGGGSLKASAGPKA